MHNTWIQDFNGNQFDVTNPTVESIDFTVTAHCLSRIPRFNGHTVRTWPVAAHVCCVAGLLIMEKANTETIIYGLHHDDSEAYICDIPSPLKYMPGMEAYRAIESRYQRPIIEKIGIDVEKIDFEAIKACDLVSLVAEAETLMSKPPLDSWTNRVRAEIYRLGLTYDRTEELIEGCKKSIRREFGSSTSDLERFSSTLYTRTHETLTKHYATTKKAATASASSEG